MTSLARDSSRCWGEQTSSSSGGFSWQACRELFQSEVISAAVFACGARVSKNGHDSAHSCLVCWVNGLLTKSRTVGLRSIAGTQPHRRKDPQEKEPAYLRQTPAPGSCPLCEENAREGYILLWTLLSFPPPTLLLTREGKLVKEVATEDVIPCYVEDLSQWMEIWGARSVVSSTAGTQLMLNGGMVHSS